MAAAVSPYQILQYFTDAGVPLSAGKLYTYIAGSDTPKATYTLPDLTVPFTNPIVLTAGGRVAGPLYLAVDAAYKFVLQDALSNVIWTADNIIAVAPAA